MGCRNGVFRKRPVTESGCCIGSRGIAFGDDLSASFRAAEVDDVVGAPGWVVMLTTTSELPSRRASAGRRGTVVAVVRRGRLVGMC